MKIIAFIALITLLLFASHEARAEFLFTVNEHNFPNGGFHKKILSNSEASYPALFEVGKTLGDLVQDTSGTIYAAGNYSDGYTPRTAIMKITPDGVITDWIIPGLYQESYSGLALSRDYLFATSGQSILRINTSNQSVTKLDLGIHPMSDVVVRGDKVYVLSSNGQVKIFDIDTLGLQKTLNLPFIHLHAGSGYSGLAIDENGIFITSSFQFANSGETYPRDLVSRFLLEDEIFLRPLEHMQVTFTGNASEILQDVDIDGNGNVIIGTSAGGYAVETDISLSDYEVHRVRDIAAGSTSVAIGVVPEPGTAISLLGGAGLLLGLRRRK